MTTPAFRFRTATTTRGLIASGEGSTEFLHPSLPTDMKDSNGFLMILNGWNLNRRMADTVGYNRASSTAVQLLQMRAPRQPLLPATSMLGVGRIIGRDYFWRYRWKDSRTGEHSGLSPLPPWRIDLGTEQPPAGSTYLGQNALFAFSVSDAPAHADTLELFRNASQEPNVVYLVKAVSLISASSVTILDDYTDDEIVLGTAIDLSNPSGPSWDEGVMYPMCKSWNDPVGRTVYYGIRRWGRRGVPNSTFSGTSGDDLVTIDNVTTVARIIEPGRVGQRFVPYQDTLLSSPYPDPNVYRIVKVESAFTFRVTPPLDLGVAAGGAISGYFAIEDDRDARVSYISEPGRPWLIDPLKGIAAGDDFDDGVMAWFSLGGTVYIQTRRRIYAALNYATLAPHLSVQFQQVADEGVVGFDAGCETPFGRVYVHPLLGVRLFDGSTTMPLDRVLSPHEDFLARDQFDRFDRASLESVVCVYDAEHHAVIVSYVPTGQGTRKETLVYSVGDRVWRGPYRECVDVAGMMRTTSEEEKFVCGDHFGGLSVREEQALEMVPASTNTLTVTGTLTAVSGRLVTDSGATFNADADERLRGSPIWFLYNSTYYFARIADVISGTQVELDGLPIDEDGSQWVPVVGATYGIGSIRWTAKTAYIDWGEPVLPKRAASMNVRFKRGTGTTSFEIGASLDADGSWVGQRVTAGSEAVPTHAVTSSIGARFFFEREAMAFQFRIRGISRDGDPQVTTAFLDGVIDRGKTG